MNRLALIADVHGNIWALEAVLSDSRRRRIDHIFDLCVFRPIVNGHSGPT